MEVTYDQWMDSLAGHAPAGLIDLIVDYLKSKPGATVDVKIGDEVTLKLFLKDNQIWESTPVPNSQKVLPSKPVYNLPVPSSDEESAD